MQHQTGSFSPADLPLQTRFSALVVDDGEKILPRETSQLSPSYIGTKKRWQVVAERGCLLREMDDPSTNLLSLPLARCSKSCRDTAKACVVFGLLPSVVPPDSTARKNSDDVKTDYLALGIRMEGMQRLCCLLHPDGEGERLD